ncbi:manganese-dependent inorganic pyrophosphatase [Piscibacillus sp. B03]|uniref:manganese-dependent inorganic pyrophosphatase n=1 Tax=Piscibacillus sp. B03 TaxID=3457430 RepID=UPI003FCE0558
MNNVLVFGHKNPDTDSICSAIAYANLKEKLGEQVEPVRLGEVNAESNYALTHFKVDAPRAVEEVSKETEEVILVDHNEKQQSASDIDQVRVSEVIDHHRIANFETSGPLYYRAEPVGCTATIIYKLYLENNIEIDENIAGLMLSAIISDTLLLKSPTTTEQDKKVIHELAKLANVDVEEYGISMLKAGTDYSDQTVEELINLDSKEFTLSGKHVRIAQLNVVDPKDILEDQKKIEEVMRQNIDQQNLDLSVLMITDILNSDTAVLSIGRESHIIEDAFNVSLEGNVALLKGVVSRKKQMVPQLTEAFENQQ